MFKLIWLVALGCIAWRVFAGRWPWESLRLGQAKGKGPKGAFAEARARALLGVTSGADRGAILDAHRRRLAQVHPDRGGSNEAVHEANAARDLLLGTLPER